MRHLIGAILTIVLFISNYVCAIEWLIPQAKLSQVENINKEDAVTLIHLLKLRKANEDNIRDVELYFVKNTFRSPERLEHLAQKRFSGVVTGEDIPNPEVEHGQIMQSQVCKYYRNAYTNSMALLQQNDTLFAMQQHSDREYIVDPEVTIHREEVTMSGDIPTNISQNSSWNVVSSDENQTLGVPNKFTSTSFERHPLEQKIYDILSAAAVLKTIEKDTTEDGINIVKMEIEIPKHGEIQKLQYSLDHGGLLYHKEWSFTTTGDGVVVHHNIISDISYHEFKDGGDLIYLAKTYLYSNIDNDNLIEQVQYILNTEASRVNKGIPLERFKIRVNDDDLFYDRVGLYSDMFPSKYTFNSLPNQYKRYLSSKDNSVGYLKQGQTLNQVEETNSEKSKAQSEPVDHPYKITSVNFSGLMLDQYQNSPEPKIHKK